MIRYAAATLALTLLLSPSAHAGKICEAWLPAIKEAAPRAGLTGSHLSSIETQIRQAGSMCEKGREHDAGQYLGSISKKLGVDPQPYEEAATASNGKVCDEWLSASRQALPGASLRPGQRDSAASQLKQAETLCSQGREQEAAQYLDAISNPLGIDARRYRTVVAREADVCGGWLSAATEAFPKANMTFATRSSVENQLHQAQSLCSQNRDHDAEQYLAVISPPLGVDAKKYQGSGGK